MERKGKCQVINWRQLPSAFLVHEERNVFAVVVPVVGKDIESSQSQHLLISTNMVFKPEGSIHDMTVIHIAQPEIIVHQTSSRVYMNAFFEGGDL